MGSVPSNEVLEIFISIIVYWLYAFLIVLVEEKKFHRGTREEKSSFQRDNYQRHPLLAKSVGFYSHTTHTIVYSNKPR